MDKQKHNKEKYIFAIDLGGTSAKCAIGKFNGDIIHKFHVITKKGDDIVPSIYNGLMDKLKELNINYDQIEVVGFASKGPFDKEKGIIINAGDIGWFNYPLKEVAENLFKRPIVITNDSRSATIGEWKKGAGRKYKSFICITIGQGVGSGIVIDNRLIEGAHNWAGEIGHGGFMQTQKPCGCGLKYCIEGLSSASGMETLLNYHADLYPDTNVGQIKTEVGRPITIKDIAPLVKKEDPVIMGILKEALKPLALRISLCVNLLDVEAILIGGGPSNLGPNLLKPIWFWLRQCMWTNFLDKLNLEICELKNDAGIIGTIENTIMNYNKEL